MGKTKNYRDLMILRFIISLPFIATIVAVIVLWPYYQPEYRTWLLYLIGVIGITVVFLLSRARLPESFSQPHQPHSQEEHIREAREHKDVFSIPTSCPVCRTPLILDLVTWKDQHNLLCQECHSKIEVMVT